MMRSLVAVTCFMCFYIKLIEVLRLRIFAGYNKSLRIFDVHRPGRDFKQHSTLQGNKEGQSGFVLRLLS